MKYWYVPALAATTLLASAESVSADWSVSAEAADPIPTATQSLSHADLLNWLADGEQGLWVQAGSVQNVMPSSGPPKDRNAGVLLQPQTQ